MPEQRAIIFANGLIPDLESAGGLLQADDLLIAADGGARHLTAPWPHPARGDWRPGFADAAEVIIFARFGARILQYPVEKNETDLELAILYACEQGCAQLRIAGALGGRLDHTLANLFLLALPDWTAWTRAWTTGRKRCSSFATRPWSPAGPATLSRSCR